ncbi:MAG: endonuclease/exonuclease/phosphatase family protein [Moraxella sp.]|nr:endonuclease/exonuclease/phosphatase family protein [Moraxella sp.]
MKPITVVSYNIHKGMSPLNRIVTLHEMGNALQSAAPDILCLQEVQGQNLKRAVAFNEYPNESQHAWFGEYLKLSKAYGKNAEYAHGHHGNAVLSRHPLDPKHNVNITVNRLEKRGVLHCEVHPVGWRESVVVLNAHLNLLHKDRVKQYQTISDYIHHEIDEKKPLILAGDFNDWSKKSLELLTPLGLTEVFDKLHGDVPATFPAKLPLLSLDRIYVRNLTVEQATVHAGVPWSRLSDHLPISAVLSLQGD